MIGTVARLGTRGVVERAATLFVRKLSVRQQECGGWSSTAASSLTPAATNMGGGEGGR